MLAVRPEGHNSDCDPNCFSASLQLSPQVRGKSMGHNSGDLFELMGDILSTARLDDKARFTQMVAETKANLEAGIIGSGHRYIECLMSHQTSYATMMIMTVFVTCASRWDEFCAVRPATTFRPAF